MPKLRKLSGEEVNDLTTKKSGQGERVRIRKQYVDYLQEFAPGE